MVRQSPDRDPAFFDVRPFLYSVGMTELKDLQPLEQALGIIDQGLGGLTERQLVSTAEVTNLLLDVRALLSEIDCVGPDDAPAEEPAPTP